MGKQASQPALQPTPDVAPWQRSESLFLCGRAYIDAPDALAIEMERRWGCGRLRLLVDPDLRARFDTQRLKFNRALDSGELEDVEREATRMCNAWRALDAAADADGCKKLDSLVWEVTLPNGKVAAIVRGNEDARHVAVDGRKLDVFTLDEIANLIHGFPEIVKVKQAFPGAEVVRVGPIIDPLIEMNDEIPF